MYPAKVPQITQLIERRIRQNFYSDRIPPTRVLAAELKVARQTMTDALKNLVQSGLLINCRRNGLMIDRSKLKNGTIVIVVPSHIPCATATYEAVQQAVTSDNWQLVRINDSTPRNLEKELPTDTLGILFTNSSLTVETAEYLQKRQIPFVSCNQLPGYRQINWVDFDLLYSLKEFLTYISNQGYKHIGVVFFGHMENFNDRIRKELLKVKRQLGLPHEPYDNAVVYWQDSPNDILNQTLKFYRQKNSYPEALLCFARLSSEQCELINALPCPPKLLIIESDKSIRNDFGNIHCFYNTISGKELSLHGYDLLRSAIFTPDMNPIQISVKSEYIMQPTLTTGE